MVKKAIPRIGETAGFTLIDMLMVVALVTIMAGIAVPTIVDARAAIRLGEGARQVERVLQGARLKAVTSNRAIRVRFNCPTAGDYRMVEVIGTPSHPAPADSAANRCTVANYPYPAVDQNPITTPNHDGPLHQLDKQLKFGNATPPILEFWPDGSVHADAGDGQLPWKPLPGAGTAVTVVKGADSKSITVNGLGKIRVQ